MLLNLIVAKKFRM